MTLADECDHFWLRAAPSRLRKEICARCGDERPSDDDERSAAHGDDPTLAKADRDVLHAAATGEGLRRITSEEQLRTLAEAAQRTMASFQGSFAAMTREQATFVRKLRCEDGYSWRAVAETCALEWGGSWGSNQLAGMAICERAAELHGESYMTEPWN